MFESVEVNREQKRLFVCEMFQTVRVIKNRRGYLSARCLKL